MSSVAPPMRARRGRVLIVGERAGSESWDSRLPHPPLRAQNLFDAIGEVTIAPAGEPIAAIVVAIDRLDEGGRAAEALRRVDPSVRLVLLTRPEQNIGNTEAVWRGFDEALASPLRPQDIQRLIDDHDLPIESASPRADSPPQPLAPKPSPASPEHAVLPGTQPAQSQRSQSRESSAPHRRFTELSESTGVSDHVSPRPSAASAHEMSAPAPAIAAQQDVARPSSQSLEEIEQWFGRRQQPESDTLQTTESLGDTDLVEALLHRPEGVQDLALRMIAQHTGWHDLSLLAAAGPIGAGETAEEHSQAVEVLYEQRRFGRLTSSHAQAAQLAPWAAWLARWLALDHTYRDFRLMAFQDDLTGAWNRRFFDRFIEESIATATKLRRPVTVMVFDIDNFKHYNDQFGHAAGDDVLRETVRLLTSVIRQGDRVCRIGGDEFAVVFADPEAPRPRKLESGEESPPVGPVTHPESVDVLARRFQDQICAMRFPKLGMEAPGTLSISAGLATFPWDGHDAQTLLEHADQLALESKRRGKNAITLGKGAQAVCDASTRR
jgi:GGDEF domain-containing protein